MIAKKNMEPHQLKLGICRPARTRIYVQSDYITASVELL